MNIFNFINIIKMPNKVVDFKNFLLLFSPENQLHEINSNDKSIHRKRESINKNVCILKELKVLKKQIVNNHKEHLQKYLQNHC